MKLKYSNGKKKAKKSPKIVCHSVEKECDTIMERTIEEHYLAYVEEYTPAFVLPKMPDDYHLLPNRIATNWKKYSLSLTQS